MVAKVGFTAVGLATALGLLLFAAQPPPPAHYTMLDDLIHDGFDRWQGTELKVHGWVVAGSIVQADVAGEPRQTFVLQKAGTRLRVFSRGPLPDTTRDNAEVIVDGYLATATALQPLADTLYAARGTGYRVKTDAEQPLVLDGIALYSRCSHSFRTTDPTGQTPEFK
ncbi:MAG TPA: cytochrome c maturation protein CcmE [Kofleriaceae bacterium]|nr:cytochrome c maturation protein CcmE [Kofleriaceae bacterium]